MNRVVRLLCRCALLLALAAPIAAPAQQTPLRELPKDARTGALTHVAENVFTLDGRRVTLAPGGMVRGANNMILTPVAVPRDSLVRYVLNADGQLSRAWILTREEAARTGSTARLPWSTSPEVGNAINQVLGGQGSQTGVAQPGQRGQAPGFMQQVPEQQPTAPVSSQTP
jgi:hypothetical protein